MLDRSQLPLHTAYIHYDKYACFSFRCLFVSFKLLLITVNHLAL